MRSIAGKWFNANEQQIMTYPGGHILPAGLFSASRAFSICSERRLYRHRLPLKARSGRKDFLPSRPKAASPSSFA